MSNILIILTDKYPYGNGETYVETERPYWNIFDRVFICPVLVRMEDKLREGFSPRPYETVIATIDKKPGVLESLRGLSGAISAQDYIQELNTLKKSKRLSLKNGRRLLCMGVLSNIRVRSVEKAIKPLLGNSEEENRLLYSYWMYEPAIVGTGLKDALHCKRLISRVHRYDLYEELQPTGYLPFRARVLNRLDRLYSISADGKNYFHEHYDACFDEKIMISRLGTVRKFEVYNGIREEVVLVSCSNLIPVKRVGLIVEALKKCDRPITWYHFGDGILRAVLEESMQELPSYIRAHLMGFTPNDDIQKFYSEHWIDALINVSESEGVPVSIMEAQSYGIPVIATDVGGTGELVHGGENGVLLEIDFSDEDLLKAIDEVVLNQQKYKSGAIETWRAMSDSNGICDEFFRRELAAMEGSLIR